MATVLLHESSAVNTTIRKKIVVSGDSPVEWYLFRNTVHTDTRSTTDESLGSVFRVKLEVLVSSLS